MSELLDIRYEADLSEGTMARLEQWLVEVGSEVRADAPLAELETDKVTVEVNATVAGSIVDLAVAEGATVQVGGVLCHIEAGAGAGAGGAAAAKPAAAPAAAPKPAPAPVPAAAPVISRMAWVRSSMASASYVAPSS